MKAAEYKSKIENKDIPEQGQIFVSPSYYVPKQWINEIASILGKEIVYVSSASEIRKVSSLFGKQFYSNIKVYINDSFNEDFELGDFCYVICKKSSNPSAIEIQKLERWQLLDYASFNSSSFIPKEYLEDLVDSVNLDVNKLALEIDKYSIFDDPKIQASIFERLYKDGQLARSYTGTIFDFTEALLNKDIDTLLKFYRDLEHYDIEPLGVVTIIYKKLKNLILVGFNKNPTEENTGLSSKQIYWIKKNLNRYKSDYILKSFQFICEAEKSLKEGTITNNQLLDYVVVNLLL